MKITSLALLCGFNEAKRFSFVDHPLNCRAAGVDVEQTGLDTTNCNPSSKRCSLVCKTTEGFQRVGAGNFRCRKNNHTGNQTVGGHFKDVILMVGFVRPMRKSSMNEILS